LSLSMFGAHSLGAHSRLVSAFRSVEVGSSGRAILWGTEAYLFF
jgi:hypothetical protein